MTLRPAPTGAALARLTERLRRQLQANEGGFLAMLTRELDGAPDAQVMDTGWAMVGLGQQIAPPRSRRLAWAQVSGLSEFHDLSRPSEADALAATLSGDPWLVPDLLTARPWLAARLPGDLRGTLHALLGSEWRGFAAQVGAVGPWVFVSGVSGVQALASRYAALAGAALNAREDVLLDAVAAQWAAGRGASLLARLASLSPGAGVPRSRSLEGGLPLAALEGYFWAEACAQARARQEAWAARMR